MATNGMARGHVRGGRAPQFLTFGLLIVICVLAFNYWNVSSKSKILQKQVQEMTSTLEELAMKKVTPFFVLFFCAVFCMLLPTRPPPTQHVL